MERTFTTFELRETDGATVLVGESADGEASVTIGADRIRSDQDEKSIWEQIVGPLVIEGLQAKAHLWGKKEITIGRDQAVSHLHTNERASSIESTKQAAALLDYFIEEGPLTQNPNGELIVLQDPEKLTEESEYDDMGEFHVLAWITLLDTSLGYLEETLDQMEAVEKETCEEMAPGSDEHEVEQEAKHLRRNVRKLKGAKEVYEDKVAEMQKVALNHQKLPSDEVSLLEGLAKLLAALNLGDTPAKREGDKKESSNVEAVVAQYMAERIQGFSGVKDSGLRAQEMDAEGLSEAVDETLEEIDDVAETVEEGTEEELEEMNSALRMEE